MYVCRYAGTALGMSIIAESFWSKGVVLCCLHANYRCTAHIPPRVKAHVKSMRDAWNNGSVWNLRYAEDWLKMMAIVS